jgi:hypothetical protein
MAKISSAKVVPLSGDIDVEDVQEPAGGPPEIGLGRSMREQLLMACETGDIGLLNRFIEDAETEQILAVRDSQTWPLLAIAGKVK